MDFLYIYVSITGIFVAAYLTYCMCLQIAMFIDVKLLSSRKTVNRIYTFLTVSTSLHL